MKSLNKRVKAFLIALLIAIDLPLIGYSSALAADAATYRTGLAPLETLIAAIVIGSGIVAGQSQQAVDALVSAVSNVIKDNTVRKAAEDPTFETPYRVIQGGGSGSDPTPEEPNDNNKNGRWFGIVGASSLGSALLFEKGAIEEIMQTIKGQNGYESMYSPLGVVSASDLLTTSSASNIALQLANISNSAVKQFDDFLHSSWWDGKSFTSSDCLFSGRVVVSNILSGIYPELDLYIFVNNGSFDRIRLIGNPFSFGSSSNSDMSLSYICCNGGQYDPLFLNSDLVSPNVQYYSVQVRARSNGADSLNLSSSSGLYTQSYKTMNSPNGYAYFGYKWFIENPWTFTNNVYNSDQTFTVNFPDWLQESITLLGKQIDAVNLGLQNLSKINWSQTQPQIQTAQASDAAVAQAINNWENPENIPEPEPEPDPEPEEQPEDLPASETAVDQLGQDIFDWVQNKITLPSGIFHKVPFCVPYDMYLLLRSMFPTGGNAGMRNYLMVSNVARRADGAQNPSGITISSHFEASGKSTRTYEPNQWEKRAPVINLDLHFAYTGVNGQKKNLDIVKSVDLKNYSYFAMIIYISTYIAWLVAMFGWLMQSFK